MPKGHRSSHSTSGYYRLEPNSSLINHSSSAITSPITPQYPVQQISLAHAQSYSRSPAYYTHSPLTGSMSSNPYSTQQQTYSQGGPVQPLSSHPRMERMDHQQQSYQTLPTSAPPMSSIRPSSGAWNPQDDATLMAARAQGMNWAPIQSSYFPTKTPNACRKRHERLMERRSADDWDGGKLENLAKNYMGMRREIWEGLARATGEKWMVVEQKCMSTGLKNLQTASRAYSRRERLSSGSSNAVQDPLNQQYDDSGVSGIDDLEAEYDADGASDHSSQGLGYGYSGMHGGSHHQRGGSSGSNGAYGGQNGGVNGHGRLPSMDMGIGAIINRHDGR